MNTLVNDYSARAWIVARAFRVESWGNAIPDGTNLNSQMFGVGLSKDVLR
jgi:hypothetical protein